MELKSRGEKNIENVQFSYQVLKILSNFGVLETLAAEFCRKLDTYSGTSGEITTHGVKF